MPVGPFHTYYMVKVFAVQLDFSFICMLVMFYCFDFFWWRGSERYSRLWIFSQIIHRHISHSDWIWPHSSGSPAYGDPYNSSQYKRQQFDAHSITTEVCKLLYPSLCQELPKIKIFWKYDCGSYILATVTIAAWQTYICKIDWCRDTMQLFTACSYSQLACLFSMLKCHSY